MTTKPQSTTEPTRKTVCENCGVALYQTADPNNIHWYHEGTGDVRCPTRFAKPVSASTAPVVDEPHKMINFLTVLEHQTHRNHEYHPVQCGECLLTETIANRIREQLGLSQRAAAPVEQSDASQSCQCCGRIGGKIVNFNYDSITTSRWICPHCLDANEEAR